MLKLVRWGYVAPRLGLAVLAVVLLWVAMNPLLRFALIRSGQTVTGAKVDIESLRTTLHETKLEMRGVEVADPRDTSRNLVQADRVCLDFDSNALLHKSFIVTEATISGVKFDTQRATSGRLTPQPPKEDDGERSELLKGWTSLLAQTGKDRLNKELEQLESVQLANELKVRWPAEYDEILRRVREMRDQVENIRNEFLATRDPMEKINVVERGALQIETMREEIDALRQKAESLRIQAQDDVNALAQAGQNDIDNLKDRFHADSLKPSELSKHLLGEEIDSRMRELVAWAQWGRKWIPAKPKSLQEYRAERDGGIFILFPGAMQRPGVLVQRTAIDGMVEINAYDYDFMGEVLDVTNDPWLIQRPMVANFEICGRTDLKVHCELDYANEVARQRIVVNCPELSMPGRTLGDADTLAMGVAAGKVHLWLEVEVIGDQIDGRLMAKQSDTRISTQSGDLYGAGSFVKRIDDTLQTVDTIEALVTFSGRVDSPDWDLRSNLGPELAERLRTALNDELDARYAEYETLVRGRIQGELAAFENIVRGRMAEFDNVQQLVTGSAEQLVANLRGKLPPDHPLNKALDSPLGQAAESRVREEVGSRLKDTIGRNLPGSFLDRIR